MKVFPPQCKKILLIDMKPDDAVSMLQQYHGPMTAEFDYIITSKGDVLKGQVGDYGQLIAPVTPNQIKTKEKKYRTIDD